MPESPPERRFEEMLARLEEIVRCLESEELDLERSVAMFEEGMALAKDCHRRLDHAERKVERLRRLPSGEVESEPFAADDEE